MKEPECTKRKLASASVVFCTVVRRGRLSRARVLAESARAHRPDAPLFVHVLDPLAGVPRRGEPFASVRAEELAWDDLPRRRFLDTADALARASRPRLLEYLLAAGARKLVYLDAELALSGDLRPLERRLHRHGVVLAPHLGGSPDDPVLLALARGPAAAAYLDWSRRRADGGDAAEDQERAERAWLDPAAGVARQSGPDGPDGPYGWSVFDNGVAVTDLIRRCYEKLGASATAFGDPFATAGRSFYTWLTARDGGGVPPLLRELYGERPDVRARFPDVCGGDREAFLDWAAAAGAREYGLDPALLAAVRPAAARPHGFVTVGRGGPVTESFGVNVLGFLQSEKGMGEHCRATVRSLAAAGVPFALNNWVDPGSSNVDTTYTDFTAANPYPINLIHLNANDTPSLVRQIPRYFEGRYNIGYWNWELEWFPPEWCAAFRHFDEIWAPSAFTQASIARVSPIPVHCVPESIAIPPAQPGAVTRGRFRLPADAFLFLFAFDFHSYFARKNPLAAVEAFRRAFPTDRNVVLALKLVHWESAPIEFKEVLTACRGQANIRILREILTRTEMYDLLRLCDAYVGLHRSEGYGLPLVEAMALGKPVIATGYSANLDFMNEFNSYPVRYRLVALEEDHGPYRKGAQWADADVEHAAEQMRRVVDAPQVTTRVAARARADIARTLSPQTVGQQIRARLEDILRAGADDARFVAPPDRRAA